MTWRVVTGALAALLLVVLVRWLTVDGMDEAAPVELDTRLDYVVRDFNAEFHDQDGRLELALSGPRMAHDPATGVALVDQPDFLVNVDERIWLGSALRGVIDRELETILLQDDVHLRQPDAAGGELALTGSVLLLDQRARTLTSMQPVEITHPGTRMRAGGLTFFMETDLIRLTNDVEMLWTPTASD